MTKRYPLLFGYRDRVVGAGFVAGVSCDGRALLVEEDGETWLYGVNPGGIAAPGATHGEASHAFREAYRAVLFDLAADAASFADFRTEVEAFFREVNEPTAVEWESAVQDVRAGKVDADWLGKRSGAPQLCIHVRQLELRPEPDANQLDKPEALATASPAAA